MLTPDQNLIYMVAAFFIILICVTIIVVGIIIVHDIPYKVAERRKNPQKDAIRCMSILGLIAFPLWLVSMIWAYTKGPDVGHPVKIVSDKAKKLRGNRSTRSYRSRKNRRSYINN